MDLSLLLMFGLLSLTWFRGNHLINGGDFGMPLDWVKYFRSMFSVWMEDLSLGVADYRNVASVFPYATFGALLQSLGFSLVFIEKLYFYLWFTGGGLSMYFLTWVLGMRRPGRILASLFYMLNPFSLVIVWRVSHALIQMPYSFAPLYLGLYIYGLREKKGLSYIFLFVLLWILTTIPAYAWPAVLVIHLTPLFFYFIFSLISFPKERSFILKFTLKLSLVFLGLNLYWLLPFVYSMSESIASAHSPVLMNDIDTLKLTSNKLSEAIRLLGYWALHSGYKGEPYYSYGAYFRSSLVNAISWFIPFLVGLGFLHPQSRKKPLLPFFLTSLVFGLLGIAGPNSFLGGILMEIYKAFPSLALLTRFTFFFYGLPVVVIYSLLLGFGSDLLYEKGKKILGKWLAFGPLIVLAFLLLFVLVKPFWTGEVIKGEGKLFPGERVSVPGYFWQTKEWFSQQKGFYRVFPLPMSKTYNIVYDWGEGFSGGDPIRYVSDNPVVYVNTGESYKIPELIGSLIEKDSDFKEAGKLLGMINVKYVLNRKDIKWDDIAGHNGWFAHTPEKIEKFLKNQKDLKLVVSFGPWDIYEVDSKDILPLVYTTDKLIAVYGEAEGLGEIEALAERQNYLFFNNEGFGNKDKLWPEGDIIEQDFVWREPLPFDGNNKNRLTEATYQFDIRTEGDYEIFFGNNRFWKYYQQSSDLWTKLDNEPFEKRNLLVSANDLLSLGKKNLKKGSHTLIISLPPFINLVGNPSFENEEEVNRSTDATEGKYSLKVSSSGGNQSRLIQLTPFYPGNSYRISFFSKSLTNVATTFLLWENFVEPSTIVLTSDILQGINVNSGIMWYQLPQTDYWRYDFLTFNSTYFAKMFGIGFYMPVVSGSTDKPIEGLIDDVKVQKIFDNPLVLKRIKRENDLPGKKESRLPPSLTFRKIKAGEYEAEIDEAEKPFWLVFSSAYHQNWKISIPGKHQVINDFANGWYIEKNGSYKIRIYYDKETINRGSLLASFLVFLSLLSAVCLKTTNLLSIFSQKVKKVDL